MIWLHQMFLGMLGTLGLMVYLFLRYLDDMGMSAKGECQDDDDV